MCVLWPKELATLVYVSATNDLSGTEPFLLSASRDTSVLQSVPASVSKTGTAGRDSGGHWNPNLTGR